MDKQAREWLADRADFLSVMLYRRSRGLSELMDMCGKVLRS